MHLGPCIFNKLPGAGPCCWTRPHSEPHGSLVCIAQRFEKKGKNLKQLLGCFLSLRFAVEPSSLSLSVSFSLCLSLSLSLSFSVSLSLSLCLASLSVSLSLSLCLASCFSVYPRLWTLRSIFTSENTDDACRICGGTKILN